MPNENLRGGYGLREAYGSEKPMLRALLTGFGKTNARAPTVAGLVHVSPALQRQLQGTAHSVPLGLEMHSGKSKVAAHR